MTPEAEPLPFLVPLGDTALLVRFDTRLSDTANRAAVRFAHRLRRAMPAGVIEIDPNLVSVLVRYDPLAIGFEQLAGEMRLLLSVTDEHDPETPTEHIIETIFGGEAGPDLVEAAATLKLSTDEFVARHNMAPLRVLATGFAPGFVYCGFHSPELRLPRRQQVRASVPPGSVLFAAGQTAITATAIPTGWHVIGRTAFSNFDAERDPPTILREGDFLRFLGTRN